MKPQYHILNGDVLKEQFPKDIHGEIIIARECLVDGNVAGDSLKDLFQTRAEFISENYPDVSIEDYYQGTVPEFLKIQSIPENVEINLWFEDDLFCQVNLWFVMYLLRQKNTPNSVFLVRPQKHSMYGFGGLDTQELELLFQNKKEVKEIKAFSDLWTAYQSNELEVLTQLAEELTLYPFIANAVKAHIERNPFGQDGGRPIKVLKEIIDELGDDSFGSVFQEFNRRESIYGFGDLQVKRMFDRIVKK